MLWLKMESPLLPSQPHQQRNRDMSKAEKFTAINTLQKVYKASWNDANDKLKLWFDGSPHRTMTLPASVVEQVNIEWVGL